MKRIVLALTLLTSIGSAQAVNLFGTKTRKPVDLGNGGSAFTVDWSRSPSNLVQLNGSSATATFVAPGGNGDTGTANLSLTVDPGVAGINGAVTWPANVDWAGGTAPTITNGSVAGLDLIRCHYNGTRYLCDSVLNLQ